MRKRIEKAELAFTTSIDKVPSLNKRYAEKFSKVVECKPITKSDKAKSELEKMFK